MSQLSLLSDPGCGATLSDCGLYRYHLWRSWGDGPRVTFLMFNPSTADASADDPTIVKCTGFAKRWGYGGLGVINLYAYRATEVKDLWKAADPVGPLNDAAILGHSADGPVVAAWGAKPKAARRVAAVSDLLDRAGRTLHAIRETASGHPEHPLFLPYALKAFAWKPSPAERPAAAGEGGGL